VRDETRKIEEEIRIIGERGFPHRERERERERGGGGELKKKGQVK
jgi:hypothetical protein